MGLPAALHGLTRMAALRVRRPLTAKVTLRDGAVMEFDYPSQLVPALVVFGDLIDPEYPFLRLVAQADWSVVDAGAAIGQFTIFAASLPCAVVHAYEPSGPNVATLERNVDHNGVRDRVVVHRVALSDADGEAEFVTAPNAYLSRLDQAVGSAGSDLVPVRTVDGELARLEMTHVSVLKVNVAGFEPQVFEGAEATLSKGAADIVIMLIGTQSRPYYERMSQFGYRMFFFHPHQRRLHEVFASDPDFPNVRPSPARHLIAIHGEAIERGILGAVTIAPEVAG